jgi:hypothetical protein
MENKKFLQVFFLGFVIFALLWVGFSYWWFVNYYPDVKEIKPEIDSLKAEIFVKQLEVQRYEYVLDHLDTNCKLIADSILNNTE